MKALFLGALLLPVIALPINARSQPGAPLNTKAQVPNAARPSFPASVPQMSGWNIDVVDMMEGTPGTIEFAGDLAYAGCWGALIVLDISERTSPKRVGFTLMMGGVRRIARGGSYLYCTTDVYPNDYLQVVDISTPTNPIVVQTLAIIGDDIAVDGGFMYLEHGEGIRVYDLVDPTNPLLRGYCESRFVQDIVARDGYVYVARGSVTGKGIQVIDASDPSNPTTLTILPVGGVNGTGPSDMDLEGNYIYALTFSLPNAFYVIDVSTPSAPVVMSSVSSAPGSLFVDVEAQGNYAYVADYDYQGGVRVFDVADPSNPTSRGTLTSPCGAHRPIFVEVSGDIGAVTAENKLCFLNLSIPEMPASITSYESFAGGFTLDVAGGHLAISQLFGWLATVNRYDLSLRYEAPSTGYYASDTHVAVKGDFAYVSMCNSSDIDPGGDGLEVFDLSDPTHPTLAGQLPTNWCAREISIGANYLYLATYWELWVIDISDPTTPAEVGDMTLWVNDLFADEPFLYVITNDGFCTIDVSDPTAPAIAANLPLPNPHGIWVSGSYAYVATGPSLLVVDVSDPLSPFVAATHPTTNSSEVRVRDNYAYLSDTDYLRIFDVSSPTSPIEVGNIETCNLAPRVAVAPPYIYAITASPLTAGPVVVFETPLVTAAPATGPVALSLNQNYPNPFNPATTIGFDTPASGRVHLEIFDVRGRLVRTLIDESMPAGFHSVTWDGRDGAGDIAPSGVYFCRLQANGKSEAKKMVILK